MSMNKLLVVALILTVVPLARAESCGNVKDQVGSVEFSGDKLTIKDQKGQSTNLTLSQDAPECTSLRKAKLANHVVFEFWGGEQGTSHLINTKYFALIDLVKREWSVKAVETDEKFTDEGGARSKPLAQIKEVVDGKTYKIELKDLETGKTETLFTDKLK